VGSCADTGFAVTVVKQSQTSITTLNSASTIRHGRAGDYSEVLEIALEPVIEVRKFAVVRVDTALNLRSGPGVEYGVITQLYPGDGVEVVFSDTDTGWVMVEYWRGDEMLVGWVNGDYVE